VFFIFLSDDTFFGSKNALIFLNSNFSEMKVNADGTLACQKSNFSVLFKSVEKNDKKNYEKTGNFTQIHVLIKYIFLKYFNSKMKNTWNVHLIFILAFLYIVKFSKYFDLFIDNLNIRFF
jgi:hypothetical protein